MQSAHGQLTVDEFPTLEEQDFSYVDSRVPMFTDEARQKSVRPFKIFDNVYYVGIDWVAAYLIETSAGLILVDSLYGKWVQPLVNNIRKLGLNPRDVKYVINTHGHFDHAGGAAFFQAAYGARVVMTEEDWQLSRDKPELAAFYMPVPQRDIVAEDGDVIELGRRRIVILGDTSKRHPEFASRYVGYARALQQAGIDLAPELKVNADNIERIVVAKNCF